MKKLLLLASILAMSGVAMAAANDGKLASDELKVKAQIIQPLKITTSPIDFGILTIGQKNIYASTEGSIKVEGDPTQNVTFSVEGLESSPVGFVKLMNGTNSLLAGLIFSDHSSGWVGLNTIGDLSYPLTSGLNFPVTGYISEVPENTATGDYVGTVKITATYDFTPTQQ